MGKYFGTDGVRGVANVDLTPELAYKLGRCAGYVLTEKDIHPNVLIGMDTRISGGLLEAALIAGLLSIGSDVVRLGVVTTPAVAYLTRTSRASAGIMISASHNPARDNGIKFFGADGFKLLDETEYNIEALIDAEEDLLPRPYGSQVGTIFTDRTAGRKYLDFLKTTVSHSLLGMKIVMDCAHGAAYELAPTVFTELGAELILVGVAPDGININAGVGSTHPERLQQEVLAHKADLGLAYDGDADRLIAVDETGEIVDGDYLLLICGAALRDKGMLAQNTIVSTVMSNFGFHKAAAALGLDTVQTAVGDRYVMEEMRHSGYNLGGEQSGHIIFLDYNTTGDGILSSLQLVDTLVGQGKRLSEMKRIMRKYPQVMINVRVLDKSLYNGNSAIAAAITTEEARLAGDGRILVRPSGTESLIRVMAEGSDENAVRAMVERIADVVRSELGEVTED
jgi:phosphoglucosamine mutase